jgi:hypothetical protein
VYRVRPLTGWTKWPVRDTLPITGLVPGRVRDGGIGSPSPGMPAHDFRPAAPGTYPGVGFGALPQCFHPAFASSANPTHTASASRPIRSMFPSAFRFRAVRPGAEPSAAAGSGVEWDAGRRWRNGGKARGCDGCART